MTVHLFLGGARSGKSRAAHDLALTSGLRPIYVATSDVRDDGEFADRVARHKADRGEEWTTVEVPLDLVGALAKWRRPEHVVVVDCLTLWLTNVLLGEYDVEASVSDLVDALADPAARGTVALVSNEVGQGIVPMHELSRAFRDHQGRCNQRVAAVAAHVRLLVAGIPIVVKG